MATEIALESAHPFEPTPLSHSLSSRPNAYPIPTGYPDRPTALLSTSSMLVPSVPLVLVTRLAAYWAGSVCYTLFSRCDFHLQEASSAPTSSSVSPNCTQWILSTRSPHALRLSSWCSLATADLHYRSIQDVY